MNKIKLNRRDGPEAKIQEAIIKKLRLEGWFVKETHGNMYQSGFPDLYCCHRRFGARWVEVKNPTAYNFTPAQLDIFPQMTANGVGVWILVADTDEEYKKLFQPANWYSYLKF